MGYGVWLVAVGELKGWPGSGIWDMGYGQLLANLRAGRDMGYGIWDMGYGVWGMGYGIWDMGYGIWHDPRRESASMRPGIGTRRNKYFFLSARDIMAVTPPLQLQSYLSSGCVCREGA